MHETNSSYWQTIRAFARLVLNLEVWLVGAMVGASIVSARLLLPTLIVAGGFWGIRWIAGEVHGVSPVADGAVILLSMMALISLMITTQPDKTFPQVYRLFNGIAFYYALVHWIRYPIQKPSWDQAYWETIRSFAQLVLQLEVWLVGAMVGASIVSARLLLPTLIVAGGFWGIRWIAGEVHGVSPVADGAVILLSMMALISLMITTQPDKTFPQVYRLFNGIAFYYALVHWIRYPISKTSQIPPRE